MEIIFHPKELDILNKESRAANKGCHICPNCGEYRETWQVVGHGNPYYNQVKHNSFETMNGNIEYEDTSYSSSAKGITIDNIYARDIINGRECRCFRTIYRCGCGCVWQSEPYGIEWVEPKKQDRKISYSDNNINNLSKSHISTSVPTSDEAVKNESSKSSFGDEYTDPKYCQYLEKELIKARLQLKQAEDIIDILLDNDEDENNE